MLLITYCNFDDVVKKIKWFYHTWDIPIDLSNGECAPPRCYLRLEHEFVVKAKGIRIVGVEISYIQTEEEVEDESRDKKWRVQ